MGNNNLHDRCRGAIGRPVEIRTINGTVHRGIIERVTNREVYIRPLNNARNLGGYGYGWGWGLATGFAFGAIASLIFLPLVFI